MRSYDSFYSALHAKWWLYLDCASPLSSDISLRFSYDYLTVHFASELWMASTYNNNERRIEYWLWCYPWVIFIYLSKYPTSISPPLLSLSTLLRRLAPQQLTLDPERSHKGQESKNEGADTSKHESGRSKTMNSSTDAYTTKSSRSKTRNSFIEQNYIWRIFKISEALALKITDM